MSSRQPLKNPYRAALDRLKVVTNQPDVGTTERGQNRQQVSTQVDEERIRRKRIENDNIVKDQQLKERTLTLLFQFLGGETIIVFVIAFLQGFHVLGFALDEWSLRLLLAATLVQTVSMLTIAIKHLFPQKDQ